MNKTYVYLHHQGFDFYLSPRELSYKERYCAHCEDEDELIGVFESEDELARKLTELLNSGFEQMERTINERGESYERV